MDYDKNFDWPEFTGTYSVPCLNCYGQPMYEKTAKKPIYDEKKRTKGQPKDEFLSDHNLDHATLGHKYLISRLFSTKWVVSIVWNLPYM